MWRNTSTKFYARSHSKCCGTLFPGSNDRTGPFHTILGLKIRKLYEEIQRNEAKVNSYTIFLLKQKKTYSKQQFLDLPPVTDPSTYFHWGEVLTIFNFQYNGNMTSVSGIDNVAVSESQPGICSHTLLPGRLKSKKSRKIFIQANFATFRRILNRLKPISVSTKEDTHFGQNPNSFYLSTH